MSCSFSWAVTLVREMKMATWLLANRLQSYIRISGIRGGI